MGWWIVGVKDGEHVKYFPPVQAPQPEMAASKRGVVPEEHEKVYAYPVQSTPSGQCAVEKLVD